MKVLLAVDLSEPHSVTEQAVQLTERLGADLMVLHVDDVVPSTAASPDPVSAMGEFDPYASYDPSLDQHLEKARENAFHAFLTEHFDRAVQAAYLRGNPAEVILNDAEEQGVDLIMLGKHHRGTLEKILLGSVASKVVDRSSRPTLLLPVPENAGSE